MERISPIVSQFSFSLHSACILVALGDFRGPVFEGERVVAVTALVDGGDQLMSFDWNPEYDGTERSPCSDLPGSHYAKCE
jgi:hypothetical protein